MIRRLQQKLQTVEGITLYMQPVQNITVDDRVSRTQYQYTLEDPDADELTYGPTVSWTKLKTPARTRDVATRPAKRRAAASLVIDRVTASRLGIAPATLDNTLYDAFGQRQINTLYTQLNQYHVILEALPHFQHDPKMLQKIYIQANTSSGTSGPGATSSFAASGSSAAGSNALTTPVKYTPSSGVLVPRQQRDQCRRRRESPTPTSPAVPIPQTPYRSAPSPISSGRSRRSRSITRASSLPSLSPSTLRPESRWARRSTPSRECNGDLNMPPSIQADFQGTAAAFQNSLSNEALLIIAALVTVYIVLGVLYESFIHPITILSTLPSAGVGALLAL